jgi:hypothetical protein
MLLADFHAFAQSKRKIIRFAFFYPDGESSSICHFGFCQAKKIFFGDWRRMKYRFSPANARVSAVPKIINCCEDDLQKGTEIP